MMHRTDPWRKSTQFIAPASPNRTEPGSYDIYPTIPIQGGHLERGFPALAEWVNRHPAVMIDGYIGVLWKEFRDLLEPALLEVTDRPIRWISTDQYLLSLREIDHLVLPFLGGDDPLFGTRFTGGLEHFYNLEAITEIGALHTEQNELVILYGCGAALANWVVPLIYLDVPKNEIQFRARAGSITNLGTISPRPHKEMYKRFYFVDWPVLNRHRASIHQVIDLFVDVQRPDDPVMADGTSVRDTLNKAAQNVFRVRPWFEPGAWGGQWIRENIPQLQQDVPNYAWSFELISPENGIMLGDEHCVLEISFDFLMAQEYRAILGSAADRFGTEFPIRFDFLDTMEGGNLSLQVHPSPEFISDHFGETFTQDETYYILDCADDAQVYLGFQETIDPVQFRSALESSAEDGSGVDVTSFVQVHPANKHDLFLIPHGTIHCSGKNNMVLEISATPYIFTFKMYDWLRLDLDGKPRPLNIDRAFANLDFSRKGKVVSETLLSSPEMLDETENHRIVKLPTHPDHFYDIHRIEFDTEVTLRTDNRCHVLSLVEGSSIVIKTKNGWKQRYNYAETFVVPAAAREFKLTNESGRRAFVVQAFVR